MDSQSLTIQEFGHRFCRYKDKKIVFYLREYDPTPIFHQYPDYKFIGVMDKYMDSGTAYEKEILSFERVLELQTDLIIIASDPAFYELIRSRIAGFCRDCGIGLFTVDGTKLSLDSDASYQESDFCQLHADQIKKRIDSCSKIIFQIYDTLFMKRVLTDTVLYELIREQSTKTESIRDAFSQAGFSAEDFPKMRQQCQQELEEREATEYQAAKTKATRAYALLERIYQRLGEKTGLSSGCVGQLLHMEQNLRRKLTVPRSDMLDLFHYAVQKGKEVIVVEDTCLSRGDLEELLSSYGVSGYQKILLSSEEGQWQLYRKLAEEGRRDSVLYIGNRSERKEQILREPGIEAGIETGIKVCSIPSAKEMLEVSVYSGMARQEHGWYAALKAGFFAAGIFNSPFALFQSKGKGSVSRAEDIGYLFLAPFVMDFMIWFVNRMKEDGMQWILFGARDGYLVDRLYRRILERPGMEGYPQGIYFPTSRLLCSMAGMFDIEDLKKELQKPFGGPVQKLLTERFLLREEQLLADQGEAVENRESYVLRHSEKILARAAQIREQYQLYGRACGIGNYEKTAFFDFFASGTSQCRLQEIFEKQLYGYYFYRFFTGDFKKDAMWVRSFVSQNVKIMENSLFMECIFTSPDPPAAAFDQEGSLVYAQETRSEEEIAYCKKLQEGVFAYVSQFAEVSGSLEGLDVTETDDRFLDYLYPDFTEIRNEIFHQYMVKDEFLGYESYVGRLYRY